MAALQLIAMGSFLTVCLVVGVRMLLLARRTRELPELTIGAAFLLPGGLGYSLILASRWAQLAAPDWLPRTWGSALLAVHVGGALMAASTWLDLPAGSDRGRDPFLWGRDPFLWKGRHHAWVGAAAA